MTTLILALEKDLFFSEKIRDTLKHHEMQAMVVRTLASFEERLQAPERPQLAIINTATKGVDWEAAISAAKQQSIPVLAFGSHVDLETRGKALQAGANKVVANSKFTSDMVGLITRMLDDNITKQDDEREIEP